MRPPELFGKAQGVKVGIVQDDAQSDGFTTEGGEGGAVFPGGDGFEFIAIQLRHVCQGKAGVRLAGFILNLDLQAAGT